MRQTYIDIHQGTQRKQKSEAELPWFYLLRSKEKSDYP